MKGVKSLELSIRQKEIGIKILDQSLKALESDLAEKDDKLKELYEVETLAEQKEQDLCQKLASHFERDREEIRDSAKKQKSHSSRDNLHSELSKSRSRSKFLSYQYQNNLEPVSEVNESRGSLNPYHRDS